MRPIFVFAALLHATLLWAREPAVIDHAYNGNHPAEFAPMYDRVRILARQAQLEVSSQLGLVQYRDGFQYPVVIRFSDGSIAGGIQSALAYVSLRRDGTTFRQELVVNLTPYLESPMDFDRVFYHEMTHVVLNDAVGGEASLKIPHWVQEGLAQFISGEGEDRVTKAAQSIRRSNAQALLRNLLGHYSGSSYPQYYLAIKYMKEKHSINAVQALVRLLISGTPIKEAVEDSVGMSWDKFVEAMHEYSLGIFQDRAQPDY